MNGEQGTGNREQARRRILTILLTGVFCLLPSGTSADVLDDLRQQLLERRQQLQQIEAKIGEYRQEVSERQEQADTLQGQIRVIESQETALRLEIDKTAVEVEKVEVERAAVQEEIGLAEVQMQRTRVQLRDMLRLLQTVESDSPVEAFFKYPSLSGALIEIRAVQRVQQRTQETLGEIHELRGALQSRSTALQDLERELKELRDRQDRQKKTLEDQQVAKQRLYEVTKAQEAEFERLLASEAAAQRRADAEIAQVEREVRAELERRGVRRLGGVGILDWPIDPIFGISCGFHCDGYPYQRILGPHAGIDLPTNMGTPVRAAADGYVARAYDSGGAGYSYVLLLHGDDLSTVYGHLSSVSVSSGAFITRGQVVGATGGAPGTRGAGLSTGPHLHFEVRKDGIPVNPAGFLP